MKKLLIALLVLCGIVLISIYSFIPGKINFEEVIRINVNQVNASRFLIDKSKWNKWWPKEEKKNKQTATILTDTSYLYKNYNYFIKKEMIQGDSIIIANDAIRLYSLLNIIPVHKDLIEIEWKGQSSTKSGPLKRIENYFQEKKIENNIKELLQSMKVFLENIDNLYNIHIEQVKVKDTILLATRYSSTSYPTISEIYNLINRLKDHILKEGALETNYPMLNVIQDSGFFKTMVAIPVNKSLGASNEFLVKKMFPGKILVTEVLGGTYSTSKALEIMEIYMDDYDLESPAIPFESLITDRSKEPDTTKWKTNIYYPVK